VITVIKEMQVKIPAFATRTGADPYSAYDWKIITYGNGNERAGAMGRTGSVPRCRDRVTEELRRLPAGVVARGEIVRTSVIDPDVRRVVAVADRAANGAIAWSHVQ
jgi:hypothetical protein